ncbi:DUF4193 family protein [Mycobacterium sp. E342]|uniref:DUF4193 family protein n=1 Tax=Mycobacterium sp. E342 TaxID=1834147 RepID=UPI0012E9E6DF
MKTQKRIHSACCASHAKLPGFAFQRGHRHRRTLELPGADLSRDALQTQVLPQQVDEFTCAHCYLAQHKRRLASNIHAQPICTDCDQPPPSHPGASPKRR